MRRFIPLLSLSMLTYCAPACVPADEITKTKPYAIRGVHYIPQKHYNYSAVGLASWYGPGFHGKLNSCGYPFDQNFLCAAHRTLPLPTIVRVTNLKNRRSIHVVVTDRGPFAKTSTRLIDLSKEAAKQLGLLNDGTAPVHIEALPDASLKLAQCMRYYRQVYKRKKLNIDNIYKNHFRV